MYRLFVLRLIAGLIGGVIAYKKGRGALLWALLCALFPPLIVAVLLLSPRLAPGRTRQCPYCAAIVYRRDTQCRSCKRELPIELIRCGACGSYVPDKEYCTQCHKKLKE